MQNAETNQKVGTAVTDVHSVSHPTTEQLSAEAFNPERPDKPEEACGVFAVLAADQPVANLTYFGLYALQHRGQESAGIAVFDAEPGEAARPKVRMHKDMGLVSQVFDQSVLERLPGQLAIGQTATPPPAAARLATPSRCCSTPASARSPSPTTEIW